MTDKDNSFFNHQRIMNEMFSYIKFVFRLSFHAVNMWSIHLLRGPYGAWRSETEVNCNFHFSQFHFSHNNLLHTRKGKRCRFSRGVCVLFVNVYAIVHIHTT